MRMNLLHAMLLLSVSSSALAASVFTTRLDDPKAVYLTAQELGTGGDDSAAIQAAIDKASTTPAKALCLCPRAATA